MIPPIPDVSKNEEAKRSAFLEIERFEIFIMVLSRKVACATSLVNHAKIAK